MFYARLQASALDELRWLRRAAVLLLAAAVLAVGLIAAGVFDPKPVGQEQWAQAPGAQTIPAQSGRLIWLDDPLPPADYSLRLTAAYQGGEADIGYGLAIGDETNYLAAAVSPLGYVAIWRGDQGWEVEPMSFMFPWQPWPHVRTGSAPNEIWLDVVQMGNGGSRVTVRLNREWLWQGEVAGLGRGLGLIGQSFGQTAVVDFQRLQLFHASP